MFTGSGGGGRSERNVRKKFTVGYHSRIDKIFKITDKNPFVDVRTLRNGKKISFQYEVYTDHYKLGISAGLSPSAVITAIKDIIEMFLVVRPQRNVHGTILYLMNLFQ